MDKISNLELCKGDMNEIWDPNTITIFPIIAPPFQVSIFIKISNVFLFEMVTFEWGVIFL